MKKLLLLLALLLFPTVSNAQLANFANIFVGSTVPVSCRTPSMFISSNSGVVYTCQSNVFVAIGVGSGGIIPPALLPDFVPGTTGTDFNIVKNVGNVLFNLPDAACTVRGVVNGTAQIFCGNKTLQGNTTLNGDAYVTGNFSTDHPIEITIADACVASEASVALLCVNPDDNKLYFSADGSDPVAIGSGSGGTVTIIGNGLISGGGVVWTGNLNFTVSAADYLIAGTEYTSNQTDITLTAADGSFPRIDAIVVDNTGTVSKIDGSASASPALPSVDATSQLLLTFVYVAQSASVPSNFSNTNIYLENTEWTTVRSPATDPPWALASTNNPFAGTKDIEATTAAAGNYVTLTKPAAGTENLSLYSSLSFRIRSKAQWPNPKALIITALNGTTQVGLPVTVKNGTFGFDNTNVSTYQLVSIPITLFNTGSSLITTFKIDVAGGGGSIGFYLDNILLQASADGSNSNVVRFADGIVPTGAINSSNQTFVLPQTPNPTTSLKCWGNGLRFQLTNDYTFNAATATITTVGTFQTGDTGLVCDYRY